MAFNNNKKFNKFKDNINEGIRCIEVRVIFPDGTNEILPTSIAIQKAKLLNLDLIVISPSAKPPVAKIIDEGKYNFEQKKQKKKQHVVATKELKFRPSTDCHDYDFKKNHAIEFLKEKNKVKAIVQFKGREISHSNLGIDLLVRFVNDLSAFGKPEAPPKQEGKNAFVLIIPNK